MYCIKCGEKLPDDAIFCSKCRTKTVNSSETSEKAETVAPISISEDEIKEKELSEEKEREKEREELITDSNRRIRETLQSEIRQMKDEKAAQVSPVVGIAVVISLISVIAFAVFFSVDRMVDGMGAFMVAVLTLALATGMFIGAGILNSRHNGAIERKEMELRKFEREVSGRITL